MVLCVTGGSMGGMQALQWAVSYPDRAFAVLPLMASSWTNHAQAIAWNKIGRRAIMDDPKWRDGRYPADDPPRKGLAVARMAAHVTYLSEGALDEKFGRKFQDRDSESFTFGIDYAIESYLAHQGTSFPQRFDANSYLHITRAIDYFNFARGTHGDLAAAFAKTSARYRFFSYDADWLYSPARHETMTQAALKAGRDAVHHRIQAPLGHDAFLVQEQPQSDLIREFLVKCAPLHQLNFS